MARNSLDFDCRPGNTAVTVQLPHRDTPYTRQNAILFYLSNELQLEVTIFPAKDVRRPSRIHHRMSLTVTFTRVHINKATVAASANVAVIMARSTSATPRHCGRKKRSNYLGF